MFELFADYEKCRALIKVLGWSELDEEEREAIQWILEEYYEKLGDKIKNIGKK